MGLTTFQKWALAILIVIAVAACLYILWGVAINKSADTDKPSQDKESNGLRDVNFHLDEKTKNIIGWTLLGLLITAGVVVTIVLIVNRKKKPEQIDEIELPKKPVDLIKAIPVWKEAFMLNTGVMMRRQFHIDMKNPPVIPANGHYVKIMNETSFSDRETGDNYIAFEVLVNAGSKRGLNVFIIKTDAGEDWIKNNWNWRVREKMSLNRYRLDTKNYPLNTPQSNQERLLNLQFEAMTSGDYTPEEIKLFETLRQQATTSAARNGRKQVKDDDEQPIMVLQPPEDEAKADARSTVDEAKRQSREDQEE